MNDGNSIDKKSNPIPTDNPQIFANDIHEKPISVDFSYVEATKRDAVYVESVLNHIKGISNKGGDQKNSNLQNEECRCSQEK